jgi:hypothetical protein
LSRTIAVSKGTIIRRVAAFQFECLEKIRGVDRRSGRDKLKSEIPCDGDCLMSLSTLLIILLIIVLLGGFSGRFGGYGYGYGHGGVGVIGLILIVLVVLMLLGRI